MSVITLTFTKGQDANGAMSTAPFWQTPADITAHIKENYIDTGKLVSTTVVSEDGTSRNITQTFADQAAEIEWKADPVLEENGRNRAAYNAEHGFTEILA